ncbi:MAG: adenylate/guanylate cyclase domain-containing protein, partial [Rhodovibrionaceae bacterium]|nr:adenylate/guanylate cyclase domain-containing protein [Rhodovibrionaceae bacterium]
MPGADTDRPGEDRGFRISIVTALTVGLAALMVLAIGVTAWLLLVTAQRNTFDLLSDKSRAAVNAVESRLRQHLAGPGAQVRNLARFVADGEIDAGKIHEGDHGQLRNAMLGSLAAAPQTAGLAFFAAGGKALRVGGARNQIRTIESRWTEEPDIPAFMEDMRGTAGVALGDVVWIPSLEAPHITISHSVRRDGVFIGVFSAVVAISELSQFLADMEADIGARLFVLYGREHVLAHPRLAAGFPQADAARDPPLPRRAEIDDPFVRSIWDENLDDMRYVLQGANVQGRVVRGPDEDLIYLYRVVTGAHAVPWYVALGFPSSAVNVEVRRLIWAAGAAIGLTVLGGLAAWFLGRGIATPVRRFADAAAAVGRLELSEVPQPGRSRLSEVDTAGRAFSSMLRALGWFETYVPKVLVLRLMRLGPGATRSEERQVSVLFTDIVGFTGISARLGPTELAELLNAHFALLAEAIEAEEGTVDKYIGDSVMAFWGAPAEQDDHAARACRAAQGIG